METIGNNELSREHAAGLFFAIPCTLIESELGWGFMCGASIINYCFRRWELLVTVYISHKIKNPRPKAEEPHGLWSPGAKAFLRA